MECSGVFQVVLNINSHFFLNNVKLGKKPNCLQELVACSTTAEQPPDNKDVLPKGVKEGHVLQGALQGGPTKDY